VAAPDRCATRARGHPVDCMPAAVSVRRHGPSTTRAYPGQKNVQRSRSRPRGGELMRFVPAVYFTPFEKDERGLVHEQGSSLADLNYFAVGRPPSPSRVCGLQLFFFPIDVFSYSIRFIISSPAPFFPFHHALPSGLSCAPHPSPSSIIRPSQSTSKSTSSFDSAMGTVIRRQ
jgi:hypothetical protein